MNMRVQYQMKIIIKSSNKNKSRKQMSNYLQKQGEISANQTRIAVQIKRVKKIQIKSHNSPKMLHKCIRPQMKMKIFKKMLPNLNNKGKIF